MKKLIITAILYTGITALVLGIIYPALITGIAQLTMRGKANGQLLLEDGEIAGSAIIGQPFSGPKYFHSRPSAAGSGYDASSSSGSNLGPTSKSLSDRIDASVKAESNGDAVPVDLVTASASGLDPDISPAAAAYQVPRIARERRMNPAQLTQLVQAQTTPRQFGLLGEPRVNVLKLNRALDRLSPR